MTHPGPTLREWRVLTLDHLSEPNHGMHVKTILNRIQKHRGFVYGDVRFDEPPDGLALTVDIYPHARNRPQCAGCGIRGPQYDRLAPRRVEFVPLWGLRVFFWYMMRRVDCPRCGVTVERVPWADGKHQLTTTYRWFLARWAKRLSWQEVARVFRTSWDQVFRAVAMAVAWGRAHVDLAGIRAIGIDEIHWQHGGNFLTLVYQIDPTRKRLLWIGQHRRAKTLLRFFRWFGKERTAALTFICSDMWKPYLKVVTKKAGQALHILDRFHIAKHLSDAIDQVRRAEVRSLRQRGRRPLLTKARWLLLKRREHQTREQRARLRELVQYNLRAVRAMLLREWFDDFWHYRSLAWAGAFLDEWCVQVMRSRLEPMKKVARMLRRHRPLLLNWFRARGEISAAIVEGFNNKAKLTARKAYGFRSFDVVNHIIRLMWPTEICGEAREPRRHAVPWPASSPHNQDVWRSQRGEESHQVLRLPLACG
jgi:transposase